MSIEQLNSALKDQPELLEEVKGYFAGSEANQDNLKRIGSLETARDEAIEKRQHLKAILKDVTGLSEFTSDSLKGAFGGESEALETIKLDNETLQKTLMDLKSDYDGLEGKHKGEVDQMIMMDTLRGLEMGSQVWNDRALKDLAVDLLKDASRESGVFEFKEDNKTLFNDVGQPMTVADKIEEMRNSNDAYYFKPTTGAGGGQGSATTPASTKPSSADDTAAYYRKHGVLPENYGKTA